MFLRKGNIVRVDYIEPNKESRTGRIDEFNQSAVVIEFQGDGTSKDEIAFIPFTSISELILVKEVDSQKTNITTQF